MRSVNGIISCNYESSHSQELSPHRPLAATMIGGRYRLLDFALSNMVNSGLKTIGIVTPAKVRPLLDHIGAGKAWNLDRKNGGIFILPGTEFGLFCKESKFLMMDLHKNVEILERTNVEYMIISGCNNIMNIDYLPVMDKIEDVQADICLVYKKVKQIHSYEESGRVLKIDDEGNVLEILWKEPFSDKEPVSLFADTLIIKKELLQEMIDGYADFGSIDMMDIIQNNIRSLKVNSYEYKGYLGRVSSVKSYYQCNMDMLNQNIRSELFMGDRRILTKTKDNPPAKYGSWGSAEDSLISGGCMVNGQVERSILFREVHVEAGAVIKNSIIMAQSYIGKDSVLENVILDKNTYIGEHSVMKGKKEAPLLILDRKKKIHKGRGMQ